VDRVELLQQRGCVSMAPSKVVLRFKRDDLCRCELGPQKY
jgi:hypothetical protein